MHLNTLMIPEWSSCNQKVVFFSKNISLILVRCAWIFSGLLWALSKNRITFLPSDFILWLSFFRIVSIILEFIQAFSLVKWYTFVGRVLFQRFSKHLSGWLFQIATGSPTLGPSAATKKVAVNLCLDFFVGYSLFGFKEWTRFIHLQYVLHFIN